MPEDKTFRYGLIVLGFFLIMIGMFIMSVEKPQVFVTFCIIGILLVLVGITWSICQCYPKITFVPVEIESDYLISKKSPASFDNGVSEKKCSQTPYTSTEEASQYEQSLPSYDQIKIKVVGSAEGPGLQSIPTSLRSELESRCAQTPAQANIVVHRDSESDEDITSNRAPETTTGMAACHPEWHKEAPLAFFQEDGDGSSSEESDGGSPPLPVHQELNNVFRKHSGAGTLIGGPPCYEDIALIDSLLCEEQWPSKAQESDTIQNHQAAAANQKDFILAIAPDPVLLERDARQHAADQEDDFYYGLKEESDNLLADECDFDQ